MQGTVWVVESNEKPSVCKKRKKRVGKRKIEFIEWGSRPLIEFLQAIGKDTTVKHSQHEVAGLILKYIGDEGLTTPGKKKKVQCDERLYALFGKHMMLRTKVYDMLEEHFAENHDDSDDESVDSSGDEKSHKKKTYHVKKVVKTPKSCFAAVITQNIELVYLKKSLILELLKVPESFECKIVGSFVRMKTDPYDIYQKNPFQLQLVTGVENVSEDGGAGNEVRLKVANYFKDVPLSMLSNDKFSKEEIEDLRDRIKTGLLKRLTVVELELKSQRLHQDITKHSIARELSLLRPQIDRANEKGWRRELFDLLDRRKLLETPSEVEKLMLKTPEVIPEELEPEPKPDVTAVSEEAEGTGSSPKSVFRGISNASGTEDLVSPSEVMVNDFDVLRGQNGGMVNGVIAGRSPNGTVDLVSPSQVFVNHLDVFQLPHPLHIPWAEDFESQSQAIANDSDVLQGQNGSMVNGVIVATSPNGHECANEKMSKQVEGKEEDQPADLIQKEMSISNPIGNGCSKDMHVALSGEKSPREKPEQPAEVIELSDDDSESEEGDQKSKDQGRTGDNFPDSVIWHYADPHGLTQGPFSLNMLNRWNEAGYFDPGFAVWREGQSQDQAVLLVDVLSQNFHS